MTTPTPTKYDRTPIRFVGADSDFIYWVTESWSRTMENGKIKKYDVSLSKRDGFITCTCPDAQYRGKTGDVMNLAKAHKCKHVSKLCHTLGAVLAPSRIVPRLVPSGEGAVREGQTGTEENTE